MSGSNVSYAGTTIGSFTGGSSGTDLVITFNANADATATQALIQNITYENTDTDNPTTGNRTVTLRSDRWRWRHQCQLRHDGEFLSGQ